MYNTKTIEKSEGKEESDPPPPDFEENISDEYSGSFRPYEDIYNYIKKIGLYRSFYDWLRDDQNPESRTIFI